MRFVLPSPADGCWVGIELAVERSGRPGLRVEVTGGRRLLLRQADRVVLLGRQQPGGQGVHYARTGRYRSPVAPLRADDARSVRRASADDNAWAARWTHRFADWLHAAVEGPLHAGAWTLAWGLPRWCRSRCFEGLPATDADQGHITWFGYGDPDTDQRDVLPLRQLSPVDAARVGSYRRQIREGIPAPVLLWWVSGLNTLLILDGHDRIVAALAEGTLPEVLVLSPASDPARISAFHDREVRAYEGRVAHLQPAADQHAALAKIRIVNESRRLATLFADLARAEARCRAWPVPGGRAAWGQHAAQLVPTWRAWTA